MGQHIYKWWILLEKSPEKIVDSPANHGADEKRFDGQDPWLLQMKEKQAITKQEEECFGTSW